ncbi:MAG: type II secretion system protein N [Halothiobacillaceae bacterium]
MITRPLLGWGLLALLFYLLFLLFTLPAQRVMAWSGVPLTEVRGTPWAGSGILMLQGENLGNLQWRLYPVWPWQGVLGAVITAEHQGWQAVGKVRLGWDGTLRVNDATLSGPLDAPFLARRLPLPLTGQARLTIPQADWRGGLTKAEGVTLELFEPKIMLGDEALGVGDLAAELDVIDGRLTGQLHDRGGPLELAGQLRGDARSGLVLEARLEARPESPTALADALRLLPAAAEGGGRIHTRLSAPWLAAPRTPQGGGPARMEQGAF